MKTLTIALNFVEWRKTVPELETKKQSQISVSREKQSQTVHGRFFGVVEPHTYLWLCLGLHTIIIDLQNKFLKFCRPCIVVYQSLKECTLLMKMSGKHVFLTKHIKLDVKNYLLCCHRTQHSFYPRVQIFSRLPPLVGVDLVRQPQIYGHSILKNPKIFQVDALTFTKC